MLAKIKHKIDYSHVNAVLLHSLKQGASPSPLGKPLGTPREHKLCAVSVPCWKLFPLRLQNSKRPLLPLLLVLTGLPVSYSVKQEISLPLPFRAHTSPPKCHVDSIDKKLETNRTVSRFFWIHAVSAHWRGCFHDTQSPFLCFMGRVRW